MKITLSENDLSNLSTQTRTEIMNLILQPQTNIEEDQKVGDEESYEEDEPFDMTPRTTRVFMQGISDKTKSFLRVFAENNGEITNEKLLKAMQVERDQELKGVFAGITRKIRRFDPSDDSDAYLIWWNEEPESEGGLHYMSKMTTESLRKYFDLA